MNPFHSSIYLPQYTLGESCDTTCVGQTHSYQNWHLQAISLRVTNSPNLPDFGLWEKSRVPRENPHIHGINMQKPHRHLSICTYIIVCDYKNQSLEKTAKQYSAGLQHFISRPGCLEIPTSMWMHVCYFFNKNINSKMPKLKCNVKRENRIQINTLDYK